MTVVPIGDGLPNGLDGIAGVAGRTITTEDTDARFARAHGGGIRSEHSVRADRRPCPLW